MNKKLFGRNDRQAQLEQLYRDAERGVASQDVDPHVLEAFAADEQLRRQLGSLASRSAPANPGTGRAALLGAVAGRRSESLQEGRRPMIGQLLTTRGLTLLAAAGIFAGGAATVGASGGVSGAADNANSVLSALHITHKSQDEGQNNPGGQTADEPTAEGTSRAVEGIPTANAQHHPADDNGVCDKGETIVKTVPSGVAVNVPCQAGEDHGQGSASNAEATASPDETPGPDNTEHSGDAERTSVPRPTQANPHATEGAGNSDR